MTNKEKATLILEEIEKYLQFDLLQQEYAEKGIINALIKINQSEKREED